MDIRLYPSFLALGRIASVPCYSLCAQVGMLRSSQRTTHERVLFFCLLKKFTTEVNTDDVPFSRPVFFAFGFANFIRLRAKIPNFLSTVSRGPNTACCADESWGCPSVCSTFGCNLD